MIQIYDTTLHDGTQREGISLSSADKLRIARRLDEFGVAFIEGGWPGSNHKDAVFFEQARDADWSTALITAFGSTCRPRSNPEDDVNLKALLDSGAPACTVVGKSWTLHVTDVLRTTLDDNLRIIEASLAPLRAHGKRAIYDAEHFFDGYQADPVYTLETLRAAARGGAETVVLCDTNGGMMPWEVAGIVRAVGAAIHHPLGIHAHNDSECAAANSLVAVREGVCQVQGTIHGYGERCGNAHLCSIIPDIELKMGLPCLPEGRLGRMREVSHFIAEVANLAPDDHLPYVGDSAFAHKGGMHVAALRRNGHSYQHVDPAMVGNRSRVIVSELAGRGSLLSKVEEYGLEINGDTEFAEVLSNIKALEFRGFSFEASVALMIMRQQPGYRTPFELIDFAATVEHPQGRGIFSEATVKVRVPEAGKVLHTAAEGNGPVNALDAALLKALLSHYPAVADFRLVDYKVRILDGELGTAATIRVLLDTQSGARLWSTAGAGTNIIEASWHALADSIEYGLAIAGRRDGEGAKP